MEGMRVAVTRLEQYDRISDIIYDLGDGYSLRFNTLLGKVNKEGSKDFFHKEYSYESDKYNDFKTQISIKRDINCYLSIEAKASEFFGRDSNIFIQIRIQDILYLRDVLNKTLEWYNSPDYIGLFAMKDGVLILTQDISPIIANDIGGGRYLGFMPIIYDSPFDSKRYVGCRIYFSSTNDYIDMDINKYMGFVYLIQTIDMYSCAQMMLNYLSRPEGDREIIESDRYGNLYNVKKESSIKKRKRKIETIE